MQLFRAFARVAVHQLDDLDALDRQPVVPRLPRLYIKDRDELGEEVRPQLSQRLRELG